MACVPAAQRLNTGGSPSATKERVGAGETARFLPQRGQAWASRPWTVTARWGGSLFANKPVGQSQALPTEDAADGLHTPDADCRAA